MWIDTHLHLDAAEFDADRALVIERAMSVGVSGMLIPSVHVNNFQAVRDLAHQIPGAVYMLGIHPVFVKDAHKNDLSTLQTAIEQAMADPKFAGIGEIGMDGFVDHQNMDEQTYFFSEQLKLAQAYTLPVVMHVRKAQDQVLKWLRKYPPTSGIAHAFNGSEQQALQFVQLNCALGFGGACTFERALQIRRLIQCIPEHAIVLETDSPDISPSWLYKQRNEPAELPKIASVIAQVRGMAVDTLARLSCENAVRVIPALNKAALLDQF